MSLSPIPLDEQARLESLRELWLLDTEPEERFDRITRLAERLFAVPMVTFALIDSNRVWFKSRVGVEVSEVPREDALCAHAILTDGIIQVEDASEDIRFRGSPLVEGAAVRFYAGAPVRSADHRRVGVLAVMDTAPGSFGPADLRTLADLAMAVESELSATHDSTLDELTGMLNLRGFHQFAEKLLKVAARGATPLSLLYVEALNIDQGGTPHGREEMLKQVAQVVEHTCRQSDVLARIGPSLFCALLPENTEHAGQSTGARLQAAVRAWNLEPESPFKLEVLVSSVRFDPASAVGLDHLMLRAEGSLAAVRAVRAPLSPPPGPS
ncbi:MAG: diguanylate cyclase [Candidatus Dormibacteraeota bacterium]|nr:diguanylate cyclase [Candidatus Dormibacteraeota bacterium]